MGLFRFLWRALFCKKTLWWEIACNASWLTVTLLKGVLESKLGYGLK